MQPNDLIAWRRRLDYSQNDAARALGCGRRSVQMWECGYNAIPLYIELACRQILAEHPEKHNAEAAL